MTKKTKEELALEAYLAGLTNKKVKVSDNHLLAYDKMRGKTLEQLLGPERALEGKQVRSVNSTGKGSKLKGAKIAATRRANGSYENNGMTGHAHKESTKQQQSIKAQIRQDIKRQLGLGKNDSIPKDILLQAYKKAGLI